MTRKTLTKKQARKRAQRRVIQCALDPEVHRPPRGDWSRLEARARRELAANRKRLS